MNPATLRPGVYQVTHTDESGSLDFNLSVREVWSIKFVAAFKDGEPVPGRKSHRMMDIARRQWIERMTLRNE